MQAFGDSFDLYAAIADATASYWDSVAGTLALSASGRFTGSQALSLANAGAAFTKSSAQNDAVHHIFLAFFQSAALSGTTLGSYIEFFDGATAQCSIVFRSDGVILLTSGGPGGTVLATWTGAVPSANQWYAFEFEVVINNTTGSFAARIGGAGSNSFSATALNTRPTSTNNYANKISLGMNAAVNAQRIDDFLWRSDPTSVPWVGDIRCYTRMPASDQSIQFSKGPYTIQTAVANGSAAVTANKAIYSTWTPQVDGTISSLVMAMVLGYTGNLKVAIYADNGSNAPGLVVGAVSNTVVNPITGNNTITFPTPPAVVKGNKYWIAFDSDTTSGTYQLDNGLSGSSATGATFASFPQNNPTITGNSGQLYSIITVTLTDNYSAVAQAQQDGLASYVYDSTVNDVDFYGIAAIGITPTITVCVTTRGFAQKSDAGSRSGAVQLKSGASTVQSTSTPLLSTFSWLWRTDLVDPATSAAWTAAAVAAAQIGPIVTA